MQLKRVDVNIRRAILTKYRQFGITTRNKKKRQMAEVSSTNHMIILVLPTDQKQLLRQNIKQKN